MKRIISLVLSAVMIIGTVLCADFSALATDVNVSNRAEWLSALTHTFDMTVEEDNYPDNYFSDLSSDSEYYYDILLAAEFGLIDVEAGDPVYPEGDITREFAAQTLNFCLGWTLTENGEDEDNYEYTFADWEDCLYPKDDQVAVNHNWLALDENNNFLPNKKVTGEEINTMLADAENTIAGDEIDEDYDSTYEYKEGTVEVAKDVPVDFNDGSIVIHSKDYNIKQGDTVVVYSNDIPVIYTAVSVTNYDDSVSVVTSDEVPDDAVEDIDMQTSFDVDTSNFIPAGGYEVVEDGSSSHYGKSGSVNSKAKPKNSIKLSQKIPLMAGESINIEVKVSNIKLSAEQNILKKSTTVKASFDLSFNIDAEFNFTDLDVDDLDDLGDLGTIPIAGIGYFEFKPEINFSGKTSFEQTYKAVIGFKKNSNGLRNISSFHKGKFVYVFEGSCKFAIKVGAGLKIGPVKAGIYAEIGLMATANYTKNTDASGNSLDCISLSGYLFLNLGVEFKVDIIVWKFTAKLEWKIFKEDNSPLRLYFHIENGKIVDECSADNDVYVSPSNIQYGGVYTDTDNSEYTYYDGNITYEYTVDNDNTATITYCNGTPKNLVIPSIIDGYKVTGIGSHYVYGSGRYGAFYGCTSLISITIPDSVKFIADSAFYECKNLTSITIPDSVTGIGKEAFSLCSKLRSVVLSNSIDDISYDTFSYCNSLKSIVIPKSVRTIFDGAFKGCESLSEVVLNEGLNYIGPEAFAYCRSLNSITIPSTVDRIFEDTFLYCNLSYINVDSLNGSYDSRNNCNAIIETETNTLIVGSNNTIIPNSVTIIGKAAFAECTSLTSITIPDSVTEIEAFAFCNCSSLKELTIPCSAELKVDVSYVGITFNGKYIANSSFFAGTSLEKIRITKGTGVMQNYDNKFVEDDSSYEVYNISDDGFHEVAGYKQTPWYKNKDTLKELIIDEGVKTIGDYAFYDLNCKNIKRIILPESVTTIGNDAFRYCSNINSINIPSNVTEIGDFAFYGCTGLTNEISIPKNIKAIGEAAFGECSALKEFYIYKDFDESNLSALSGSCIEKITIDSNNNCFCLKNGALFSKDKSVLYKVPPYADSPLKIIPNGVNKIWNGAFDNCDYLESLVIPEGVTELYSLGYVKNLKELYLPESVKKIPGRLTYSNVYGYDSLETIYYHGNEDDLYIDYSNCGMETTFCNMRALIEYNHHAFYEEIKEPTCVETGLINRKCNYCDYKEQEEIPQIYHNYIETEQAPATCSESGYVVYTCTMCNDVLKSYISPSIPHSYVDGVCSVCGAYICVENGHTFVDGVCTVCGAVEPVAPVPVPVGDCDHEYVYTDSEPATCTESGCAFYQCIKCDSVKTEIIPAIGHDFSGNAKVCKVCGEPNPDYKEQGESVNPAAPADSGQQNNPAAQNNNSANGSQSASAEIIDPKLPKAIISKAKPAKKQIKLTWKKAKGVSGYQIQYSLKKNFKKAKKKTVKGAKKNKLTIKKLKSGKKYFIRIRTYKVINGKKVYSKWSKVKKVKVK